MNKPVNLHYYLALTLMIFITFSCNEEEPPERTPEMEAMEIDEILKDFIDDGIDIDTTDLGVYYFVEEEGTGPYPEGGDTLFMKYHQFINGVPFESSYDYNSTGIWRFIYLYQNLPTGFNDAIALMNKGSRLTIIVPSQLGYGAKGTAHIPPYTPLQYKAEMHDLIQKKKYN